MAGHQRRKHNLAKHKEYGKVRRTRNYQRDLDQVVDDLEPQNFIKLTNQAISEDKPGLGQFYCVWCSKYFITKHALDSHQVSKEHKKRVKVTKEEPYTIKDSLRYGGVNVK
jgi:bud site selection protein 20